VRPLPRFTSPKVRHLLEFPEVKPYSDLAAAYAASEHSSSSSSSCGAAAAAHAHGGGGGGSDRLLRVAEQHMNVFSAVRVFVCCGLVRKACALFSIAAPAVPLTHPSLISSRCVTL
jgi:hypothetical protein